MNVISQPVPPEAAEAAALTGSHSQRVSLVSNYAQLFKLRVTSLVVMTAWAGYFLASRLHGVESTSWNLVLTLAGIGLVSCGAAALNQVLEHEADALMLRTRNRPLPAARMGFLHALAVALVAILAGSALLWFIANPLTAILTLATAASYAFLYTPLKQRSPVSTFVGAFPGAMPPLLGWVAVSGHFEWQALSLFAILFFWQFPHFLAIAWLYREDYERARILMLPVVDLTGAATMQQILFCSVALVPISTIPFFLHIAGEFYLIGSIVFSLAYLWFGIRLGLLRLPPTAAASKRHARQLLQASVLYLPGLLFLMMINGNVT